MKLTVMVAPRSEASAPTDVGPREFNDVDAFATALEAAAGVAVLVIEGSLGSAPEEGFLVVFDSVEVNAHTELGPRTILVNADRADIPRRIERLGLAGSVEKHRYVMWRNAPEDDGGYGLIGLREVAARIDGASADRAMGDRYVLLAHPRCRSLPELLVTYLTALERR